MERYINSVGWLAMASCMFILGCTQPSTSKNDSQPDRPSAESESAEIAEAFEAKQQTLAATQNSESFFTVDLYDPPARRGQRSRDDGFDGNPIEQENFD